MTEQKQCPQCGQPVSPESLMGLCPDCMLKAGLASQTEAGQGANQPVPPPLRPEEIARFFPQLEILECLGRGGMGAVYKARQPKLNRFVALKILAHEKKDDPKFAERFTREAQALAQLNHPNIVTVYEFGETEGLYYLLMEYVDGMSLRRLLHSRKMKPEEALMVVPRVCEALQFAHDHGIVHRDIKPENILLDKEGRVKIADFGIAKMLGSEGERTSLTGEQQIIGTPHYMAPEQVEQPQLVDHRADIYSLGVVFYEMLTGELPLGNFTPPSRKVHVDVRLDEVVLRALEKEPERRYQQASQVKTDVETIAGTPPGAPPTLGSAASSNSPGKSPDAIKIFGILQIILGGMSLLCCTPYIFLLIPLSAKAYDSQPLMMGWLYLSAIVVLPASCVDLAAGIGLCYRKSWARKLTIYKAVFSFLFTLIGEPIILISILTNTVIPTAQKKLGVVSNIPISMFFLIYWILVFVFLNRKNVKEALGEIE